MANSPKRPCTICRRKTKSGEQPCIDIGAAVRCNLTIEEDHSDKGEQEPRQRVSRPNGGHQCLLPEPTHQCNSKDNEEAAAESGLEKYFSTLDRGGKPLSKEVRNFYEPRFGYDFSKVKVHTNSIDAKSAQSINAIAYTSGNNIVFNDGQYNPDTEPGKKLLAHELTHVVQQNGGRKRTNGLRL